MRESSGVAARTDTRLSREEIRRYGRHLILPEVGLEGQAKLKSSSVLLVGAGGLGSPLALYLAAAGVGRLGIVDFDVVDESNLQRQILHSTPYLGRPKLVSAKDRIHAINPHVDVELFSMRLDSGNALEVLRDYDVVADGTDNFPARYLINDACVLAGKPFSHAGVLRFQGQTLTVLPRRSACLRCVTSTDAPRKRTGFPPALNSAWPRPAIQRAVPSGKTTRNSPA